MDHKTEPLSAATLHSKAIVRERFRNARIFGRVRLFGVGIFLIIFIIFGTVLNEPGWRDQLGQMGVYFSLSFAVFFIGERSARLALIGTLMVPFLDTAMVFWIQMTAVEGSADRQAVANFSIAIFATLIVLSNLTLLAWPIITTLAFGLFYSLFLQSFAGVSVGGMVSACATLFIVAMVCVFNRYSLLRLVERSIGDELRVGALRRYFSPAVAKAIEQSSAELDGQTREVTVLFSDIRGFTALAESLPSDEVVSLLNDYHRRMVDAIFSNSGTLDKYMGDGIMAYFGAPMADTEHASRAVSCAIHMLGALDELNAERERFQLNPLRIGIGIHSGPALAGNIGAPHRREYTLIGDTVNIASRLEGLTVKHDIPLILSAQTASRLDDSFEIRLIGETEIRGKTETVEIYTLEKALHFDHLRAKSTL